MSTQSAAVVALLASIVHRFAGDSAAAVAFAHTTASAHLTIHPHLNHHTVLMIQAISNHLQEFVSMISIASSTWSLKVDVPLDKLKFFKKETVTY